MEEVLERGDVAFFFRPTVQAEDALEATLGVQSFFMVLSREGNVHRRVRVGRKRLPSRPRERFWARVERVGSFARAVGDQLEAAHYSTKTRGERYQPGARPLGQGSYDLVRHDDHVHFRYALEHVEDDGPEGLMLDEHGDALVLFESAGTGRAIWSVTGDIANLDREGYEIVLVGHDEARSAGPDGTK